MEKQIAFVVKKDEDRKAICAILAENGYKCQVASVKVSKASNRTTRCILVWVDEERDGTN